MTDGLRLVIWCLCLIYRKPFSSLIFLLRFVYFTNEVLKHLWKYLKRLSADFIKVLEKGPKWYQIMDLLITLFNDHLESYLKLLSWMPPMHCAPHHHHHHHHVSPSTASVWWVSRIRSNISMNCFCPVSHHEWLKVLGHAYYRKVPYRENDLKWLIRKKFQILSNIFILETFSSIQLLILVMCNIFPFDI